jgi:hypothetical protein
MRSSSFLRSKLNLHASLLLEQQVMDNIIP